MQIKGNISQATNGAPKIKVGAKGEYHQVMFDLYHIKLDSIYDLVGKRLTITIEETPEKLGELY